MLVLTSAAMLGVVAFLAVTRVVVSCVIQGHDIGVCTSAPELTTSLKFCGSLVRYTACVPKDNSAFHLNFTSRPIEDKDDWVRATYTAVIQERLNMETDAAFRAQQQAISGESGDVKKRFSGNSDCQNAYKNFICWLNFPRCNDEGESLIMCRSVCENYFKSCKYSKDMWRCGAPQYYGGSGPEPATDLDANGNPQFWRAQYPGQPFRKNVHDYNGNEVAVCTPALTNAGSHAALGLWSVALIAFATLIAAMRGVA